MSRRFIAALAAAGLLAACERSAGPEVDTGTPIPPGLDRRCDLAPFPSPDWTACELRNFARISEAPLEGLNPALEARALAQGAANLQQLIARALADPSWLDLRSGNTLLTPWCAQGGLICVGDPFRYPQVEGPNGRQFYEREAVVTPVLFYDRECARISGRVWRPRAVAANARLPAVVIENGSIGAPEQAYWWAAQALVRAGYMVLTSDPRGQGLSDFHSPHLVLGTNLDPSTFWLGLIDAIDFLHSTPRQPYPWNLDCAGIYPTAMTAYNPEHTLLDRGRLGIAGHSFGAAGAGFVQSYGAAGAGPWPGRLDTDNPVKAIVTWDALGSPDSPIDATVANYLPGLGNLGGPLYTLSGRDYPAVAARVPAMNFSSEYGIVPAPFLVPPDPDAHRQSLDYWQSAGRPVYSLVIAGSTHQEWSQIPLAHATSWCAGVVDNACVGSWGLGLSEHYSVAWFDRWLKRPGEPGYADADARLLDDSWVERLSWHFRSARSFPDRQGRPQDCADLRASC